jgi:hypothetical protein
LRAVLLHKRIIASEEPNALLVMAVARTMLTVSPPTRRLAQTGENDHLPRTAVPDAETLPAVTMPYRNGFSMSDTRARDSAGHAAPSLFAAGARQCDRTARHGKRVIWKKTALGFAEIKARSHHVDPAARNLLLLIDGSKTQEMLQHVDDLIADLEQALTAV